MKSLSLYETTEELDALKQRVIAGETVYTVVDGKTVLLLPDNQAKLAGKREVTNLVALFPIAETDEDAETETAQAEDESYKAAAPYAAISAIESRLDKIEEALQRPLLPKAV